MSNDAPPSSSTPVAQEGTVANPVKVDVEVHEVPESELDEDIVSETSPTTLVHTTLGTQTGSQLPSQEDPFQPFAWEIMENPERILTLDPTMPMATLVGRIRAHLSPVRGYATGGKRVLTLDGDDLVALEGYVERLGWEKLSTLQPQQVDRTGVRCLVKALKGTVVRVVQSEDNASDTSEAGTTGQSQLGSRSEQDPLGLNRGGSEPEEGEIRPSSPEAMSWDMAPIWTKVQPAKLAGPLDRRLTLRPKLWMLLASIRSLRVSLASPWKTRMRGIAVMILNLHGVTEKARRLNVVKSTLRYDPTRSLPTRISLTGGTKGRT